QGDAPDRSAAGRPRDHSPARPRVQQHAQDHVPALRTGPRRALQRLQHQARSELPTVRAVSRLRRLVPAADHDLGLHPVVDRATARQGHAGRRGRRTWGAGPDAFLPAPSDRSARCEWRPLMTQIGETNLLDAIGGVPLASTANVVEVTDLHKWFGRNEVLKGISMTVRQREVVVVCGPSGSGKTTFIRCVNHLEKIQQGRIMVNGHLIGYREENGKLVADKERNIARQRQEIGMVFQRFNLFPHKTALGNIIEAPIQVRGVPEDEAIEMGRKLLARVGLAHKEEDYPAQLSGGATHGTGQGGASLASPDASERRRKSEGNSRQEFTTRSTGGATEDRMNV